MENILLKDKLTVKNNFLISFFNEINNIQIDYCVMHGYEELPFDYEGHDLDILINRIDLDKIKEIIWKQIKLFNINVFRIEERQQLFEFVLFTNSLNSIVLQFLFNLDYRGIQIFSNKVIFNESIRFNNIKIPKKFYEDIYAFFSWYLWGKKIKDKYLLSLKEKINDPNFNKILKDKLKFQNEKFISAILDKNNELLLSLRARVLTDLFFRNFSTNIISVMIGFYRRFRYGIYNAIINKGKFIALIGPDGVGKTLIAKNIYKLNKDFFRGIKYFHFLPDNIHSLAENDIKDKSISKKNISKEKKLFSVFKLIRNILRFNIYNLKTIYYKYKQNLIIGDRYFYNYFYYPESVKYFANHKLIKIAYKFIPKPDFIFVIIADTTKILERKNELNKIQIEDQIKSLRELHSYVHNSCIIENNSDSLFPAYEITKKILGFNN